MKSIFDANGKDLNEFQRHQRDVQMLQKLPAGPKRTVSATRKLSPLRGPPRPANISTITLQGLDMLFLPGDLQRSESGTKALSASAPAFVASEVETARSPKKEPSTVALNAEGDLDTTQKVDVPKKPSSKPSTPAKKPPTPAKQQPGVSREGEAQWSHVDQETERRSWRAPAPAPAPAAGTEAKTEEKTEDAKPAAGISMLTGMSVVDSELKYADDWDEFSMSAASSPARSRVGPMDSSTTNAVGFGGTKTSEASADTWGTKATDKIEPETTVPPAEASGPTKPGRRQR